MASVVGTCRLHLIIGPMFAGKSTEVIRLWKRYSQANVPVLPVHHALDTRYAASGGFLVTHDDVRVPAHSLERMQQVSSLEGYARALVVIVEEAQFFDPDDLVATVTRMVDRDGKTVVVSGLDGDFQRQPFPGIMRLIPLADTVTKLEALCTLCKDGTTAPFTQRWQPAEPGEPRTIAVGGAEMYRPVCRHHFVQGSAQGR